jgi:DNA polymerase III sliding clamp (beta) subunit (PCNA family)
MDILQALKFVQGGVSTKDLVPEMKHFAIEAGEVRSFNGIIALACPIDIDLECKPRAAEMVAAIQRCEDATSLAITKGGRLRVLSGRFRAFVPCIETEVPHLKPEGTRVPFNGEALLAAVRTISRFVGDDASRPWTNGILLRGQSAFATNNVCLVEYWIGSEIPNTVNIPMVAIKEIARIGIAPIEAQLDENSITLHYSDGRWLRTQLYSTEWPDIRPILDAPANYREVPEGLFECLDKLAPFTSKSGVVRFDGGEVCTSDGTEEGAAYQIDGLPSKGRYHIKMLSLLKGVATAVDFSLYPKPVLFQGEGVRGAILGLRE